MKICPLLVLVLLCSSAGAQPLADYEAGRRAYSTGDLEQAFTLWLPLAEAGDPRAQFRIGLMYDQGAGVRKSDLLAADWFRRAAEGGIVEAQFNLGNAYKHGRGVPADEAEAAYWWSLAAEQNFASAQVNLGTQYLYGLGVKRDLQKALLWYQRAAANGHPRAARMIQDHFGQFAESNEPEPAKPEPSWLERQTDTHFVIQLAAMSDADGVTRLASKHGLDQLLAVPVVRSGRRLVLAVLGPFPDRVAAVAAMEALPLDRLADRPWIRQVQEIR